MFRGYYEHNINNQGRVSLPAKFRQTLEEKYSSTVVMVGLKDHIDVYPEKAYREIEEKDMGLAADDPRVFQFLAVQHFNVFETDLDGNGRILLPQKLRNDLGLSKEVVIVGLMNRILIYHPDRWGEFIAEARDRHEENSLLVSTMRRPAGKRENE